MPITETAARAAAREILTPFLEELTTMAVDLAASLIVRAVEIADAEGREPESQAKGEA